jgi:D-galactarolactone cycloisomerase
MKIRDITTIGLQMDLPRVFSGGTYSISSRATIITEIHTDDGCVGRMYSGDTRGNAQGVIRSIVENELKPDLIGQDLLAPERLWERMFRHAARQPKRRAEIMEAISAIDIAVWDAVGKVAGLPVHRLWGGYRDDMPMISIGGYYEDGKNLDGLKAEVQWLKGQGMAGMKLKVGLMSVEDDIQRLTAAREAGGDGFLIACAANRAWTIGEACAFAERATDLHILWLEEPVQWHLEADGLTEVRSASKVPVNAGQSEVSAAGCIRLIDADALDYCNVDASYAGGPTEWRRIAAYAQVNRVMMAHHEEPQVALHLLASVPNAGVAECFASSERDPLWPTLIENRPPVVDGVIALPEGPGFGWRLNEEVIVAHRV